jgi:hypothetical protein
MPEESDGTVAMRPTVAWLCVLGFRGFEVVLAPEVRQHLGDDDLAMMGALRRRADVPVGGNVVGRSAVEGKRNAARQALERFSLRNSRSRMA